MLSVCLGGWVCALGWALIYCDAQKSKPTSNLLASKDDPPGSAASKKISIYSLASKWRSIYSLASKWRYISSLASSCVSNMVQSSEQIPCKIRPVSNNCPLSTIMSWVYNIRHLKWLHTKISHVLDFMVPVPRHSCDRTPTLNFLIERKFYLPVVIRLWPFVTEEPLHRRNISLRVHCSATAFVMLYTMGFPTIDRPGIKLKPDSVWQLLSHTI